MPRSEDKTDAVLALKIVAAKAEKLARDLDRGQLWEGELASGLQDIEKQLGAAHAYARSHGGGC